MTKHIITLLLIMIGANAMARVDFVDVKSDETWQKVKGLAQASNKFLFVYAEPTDCKDCRDLRKQAFKNKSLEARVKKDFIATRIYDFTSVGNRFFGQYFLPSDAPSFLLFNSNGVLFDVLENAYDAQAIEDFLIENLPKLNAYPTWQKDGKAGTLSKENWISFLLIEAKNNRVHPKATIVRQVSSMLDSSDFDDDQVQDFVMQLGIDIDGPIFQTLKIHPNIIDSTASFNWPAYFQRVFNFNLTQAIAQQDSVLMEDMLHQLGQMPDEAKISHLPMRGRQLYTAEIGHWQAYDTLTMAYLQPLPTDSADAFQREAMRLMEFYDAAQADQLANKYLRIGLERKETFLLYYTLGVYLYKNGDDSNAYRATVRAIKFAGSDEEREQAGKFLDFITRDY